MAKRAALGLQLSPTGSMRDTIGVFVARVTPKGPAENAGIIEGDRIISINGIDLRVNAADAGDSYASDLPTRRLTREVQKLTPGKVVTLRVWSAGRIRDVNVTAGRASDIRGEGFGIMFGGGPEGMMLRSMPGMNGDFQRMNIESFPRMRMEDMPRMPMEQMQRMRLEEMPRLRESMDVMRERMRDLPMRIREMDMAPMTMRLREDGFGHFPPSRVRVVGPDGHYIYRDSTGKWSASKSKEERAKADKAAKLKAEKEKEKN
jgi:PDZ domain-containing protein